jgi:hypothetical protein
MKWQIVVLVLLSGMAAGRECAADCSCDDWMKKGGYCVDYVKERIPSFPIPQSTDEIALLKNKDVSEVSEGDVAIFDLTTYWHVAYVEKVHLDAGGAATSIDVSEMNFGDRMSYGEFRKKWKTASGTEWKRAICCGVTERYEQVSSRRMVPLSSVRQVWSPTVAAAAGDERREPALVSKVKRILQGLFSLTGIEL